MSPEIEHEHRIVLAEYLAKFHISSSYDIPDPLELKVSDWVSESDGILKWPSLLLPRYR